MKSSIIKQAKNQAKIKVQISSEKLKQHFQIVFDKLATTVEIKGFRPGKAPQRMIVEQIGINRFSEEVLNLAVQDTVPAALKEHSLRPATQPRLTISKWNFNPLNIDGLHELEYELDLDLIPEVKLGDYTKIRVTPNKKLNDFSVSDQEVGIVIEKLQAQSAKLLPLERDAKEGDWAEISFNGKVDKVVKEALTSQAHPVILGQRSLIPGFEENIIGMKKGDTKSFSLKLPNDFREKNLAGKNAEFEVELRDLKEIEKPALDKPFAAKFGHSSIKNLRHAIKKNVAEEKKQRARQALENEALDKALKLFKADIPDGLVSQEAHRRLHDMQANITRQGLQFDKYLASIKKTQEDLENELKPQAKQSIQVGLLLGEVAKREKFDLDDKEVTKKALDYLVEIATK